MKKRLVTMWLLLTAGVVGYSQKNTNQPDPNNITIDRENPCREFMMEVFPDKGNCSAQILNVYAWGVKENEQISWQLLDATKASKASGTFTATQTRNVNQRIELPNLPSGNYTFVATSTSCPKSPKEYSLHLEALLQMSLLEKQDIGCNNKSSDKGSVLLRVSGGEKGSYIYGYEKIEEGHKPCGDSFDIRKPNYANDNIDGAPTYDGVPCWQKGTTNGNTFISLDEGIWRIYAMDPVRGCVVSDTVTIRRYPILSITSIVAQLCQVQTDGTIPVHITLAQRGQGKHYYQLNGQAEQPIQFTEGNTFILNVLPNSYKITIRDEKGCYAHGGFEVKAPTPIQLNVRAAKATCATEKGQLTLSIVSKEATATKRGFSYRITNNTVVTGTTTDNSTTLQLPAGFYQIEVTVAETGCKLYDKVLMPEPPAAIQITATSLCSKDCTQENGEIALHISGGEAPYKVRLVHQPTKNELTQTLNSSVYTFRGVTAGNYIIEVQDAAGCSRYEGTTSVTVQPSFVLKNISFETLKKATCERKEEVLVKVAVTPEYVKGTWLKYIITNEDKKYRREIRLDDTTLQLNGAEALGVGKYHIEVLNEQTKCSIGQDYEVKSVAEDYRLVVGTPVKATCASDKGQLTLSVVPKEGTLAKTSGFSYRLTAGSTVVTGTSTDNSTTLQLPAGFYQIEVTVAETGCKLYDKVLMPEPPAAIQVTATSLYSKDCRQENGEIALHISGGQAPYKVRLVHQTTKNELTQTLSSSVYTFTGVTAGNYTIEVQDAAGCSRYEGTTSVTVQPSFVLKNISFETLKKATCERKEEVVVKVAVTPKYVKGTWLKYIITSEDKKYRREIRLDDTSLQLNGAEALGVGKYHIEVLNEQTQCSIGEDYEVKSVAEDYRLVVGTPVKATCSSGKGLLTLSIQNKEASATKVSAFDYRITANSVVTGTSTNGSAMIRLSAGSYQIEVTVAETGCKLYGKVIMPEPPAALKLATTVQASANCEDAKGAAIVQVSGGVSPYTITLTHKRTGAVYSETNVGVGANAITLNFSDLKSGYYYAHVQDAAGCEAMGSVTIEEYTPIVLSKLNAEVIAPSCGDANDGKLIFEVQVSGGVPPYKYKLEKKTEKTSEHTLITVTNGRGYIENLSSGSYQLLVEDSKNCITTITETTIIAPKPISVDIKVNKSHSQACDDSQNGSVTLSNIAGGSGFYRIYLINHEKKTVVDRKIGVKAGETITFGNLASSYNIHYEIAIQDSKGCLLAHLAPFTIDEEPDVAVQSVENEINCDPTSNKGYVHTLVVKFSNNVVDYDKISYNLNNGTERSFTRTAGNIAFIDDFDAETLTQTLTVNYKPMGVGRPICPASIVNFSLTRFPQFTLERVPNDDLNVIEVIAKGGVTDLLSGYTYYFNGENQGNNPVYTIKNTDPERIEAGGVRIKTIEVKAKDAKDCIRTLVVEVPYIDIDIPNYFTPNGDGDNDRWRPKKMEDFPNAFVHVFDRNGRRMATLKPGESWDGIYAGKPMPSGDYWYTIDLNDELRDGRKIYGHFSLYR
ncbi:T9SS type B sorting domain-containing protein [Capnocytophaga leadbetteri]|uniref:T9SS type B sorting domain-containing protein n=1 Tax=Capnocytophaga leadbetteri TaxID=327575 RepID=UPI0026EB7356|nr:T9SS type B sorting domain-containing protein [Capnocytophaga leadbetteri]